MVRSRSQIDVRTRFLLAIDNVPVRIVTGSVSAVMTEAAFSSATTVDDEVGAGYLFRDLGKSITTIGSTGLHTQVWRLVQSQRGGGSEGVFPNSPTLYILVWAANPATNPVTVVRFG